jgi:sigma-B regulation protein RsbU (phosphoserine phosphatase)
MGNSANHNSESGDSLSSGIVVLLIDDQAIVGQAIKSMLSGVNDLEFHYCQNPFESIEMASKVKPTVILQDLVMPEVDGLTLVKFFRAHSQTKDTPLVVLSSTEDPKTKAEAFALGANDYLVKLPDKLELIARIRYHSQAFRNLVERKAMFSKLQASESRMALELQTGARYVSSLLPPPIDQPIRIDWRFVPSAELGGDSLGYFPLDDDRMVIFLLDVTGHGLASALLGVTVSNILRAKALPNVDFGDPSQVLAALNASFQMEQHDGRTFTMWYGVYNRKQRHLVWSGGGHPSALLYRKDQSAPIELESQNPGVGMFEWDDFEQSQTHIPEEARLFLFSDGAFEILKQDGNTWTWREFIQFMSQPNDPNDPMADRLTRHVRLLKGEDILDDDFSIMEIIL